MSRRIHLFNGIIITDPKTGEFAHSITIQNGVVIAINDAKPQYTECIDLCGRCAIPGFIDSHLHLVLSAMGLGSIDLQECRSRDEFTSSLSKIESLRNSDKWLIASGWSKNLLGEMPDKHWISPEIDTPTLCYSSDFHCAIINQSLINSIQIEQIQSMVGGQFAKQGIVSEDALFYGLIPQLPEPSSIEKLLLVQHAVSKLHKKGVTLIGSMESINDIKGVLSLLMREKCIRVRAMCHDEPTTTLLASIKTLKQDDYLKVTGFKTFLDGTLGSRTAKMYSNWIDTTGSGQWTGHAGAGKLEEWVETVCYAGYSPALHAIGDEAVGKALKLLQNLPKKIVPRIEHVQFISPEDISKVKGMFLCVQPVHLLDDELIAPEAVDVKIIDELHQWKRMLRSGGLLSFGSDWPISPPNPLLSMKIAISRGLSPQEALVACTTDAAASVRTPKAGNLNIGSFGDVVILDENPLEFDWNESVPSVTMTILSGEIVFTKEIQNA